MRSRDLYRHADRAARMWDSDTYIGQQLGVVLAEFSLALRSTAHQRSLTEEFPDLEPDPERETADR